MIFNYLGLNIDINERTRSKDYNLGFSENSEFQTLFIPWVGEHLIR